jgi:RHS repeat-associated protein
MDVMQERDDSNATTANLTRQGNIGGILARTVSGANRFYHYDGSDNVVQVTKGDKTTMATYEYDAYGVVTSSSGTEANSNPYRYQAKEVHTRTGFVDFGYRFYSPSLGRWINRDPIEESGGLNLYVAFTNDPINVWDEYGESILGKAVGGIINLGRKLFTRSSKTASRTTSKTTTTQAGKSTSQQQIASKSSQTKSAKASNQGFTKQCQTMADSGLRKTIKSLEKRLREHQDKIKNNPQSRDVPHWRGEIKTYKEQLVIARKEAKRRGW